ncbi:hypothetical protein OSTOST_07508 [Ostertagia ostertagi]
MCSLMRRSGRAQLIVWDRSGRHPVDPGIESAAEMLRGLEIGNKYSIEKDHYSQPDLYQEDVSARPAVSLNPQRLVKFLIEEEIYFS